MVGDAFVGKTAIMLRYLDEKFEYFMHDPTDVFEYRKKYIKTEDGTIKLRVFEMPGEP